MPPKRGTRKALAQNARTTRAKAAAKTKSPEQQPDSESEQVPKARTRAAGGKAAAVVNETPIVEEEPEKEPTPPIIQKVPKARTRAVTKKAATTAQETIAVEVPEKEPTPPPTPVIPKKRKNANPVAKKNDPPGKGKKAAEPVVIADSTEELEEEPAPKRQKLFKLAENSAETDTEEFGSEHIKVEADEDRDEPIEDVITTPTTKKRKHLEDCRIDDDEEYNSSQSPKRLALSVQKNKGKTAKKTTKPATTKKATAKKDNTVEITKVTEEKLKETEGGGEPNPITEEEEAPEEVVDDEPEENDGIIKGMRITYNWKYPQTGFNKTATSNTIPNLKKVNAETLDLARTVGDDKGEQEYIAKRQYNMLWKLVLEPPGKRNFMGYRPGGVPEGTIPLEHWNRHAERLTMDQIHMLRMHDDFAARTTVKINMSCTPTSDTTKEKKPENDEVVKVGKYPGWRREPYVTNDPMEPVIPDTDYAPNPDRMVLPMTPFSDDHPLLVTDTKFNTGRIYYDENVPEDGGATITSLAMAKRLILAERGTNGYPQKYPDGTEDQTVSGANGRPASLRVDKSGDWAFARNGEDGVLRGTGVPWGGLSEYGTIDGGWSCAIDSIIMLGRYIGAFYREGDKPRNASWDEYVAGLTGPQRMFRELVGRDWDRTPVYLGILAKQEFWFGVLRQDEVAGLKDWEAHTYWSRRDDEDHKDEADYVDEKRERIAAFKENWANKVDRSERPNTGGQDGGIDVARAWKYVFGEERAPEIRKQCGNFNFRTILKVHCRDCNRLFDRDGTNHIPQDEGMYKKGWVEAAPVETLRSFIGVAHTVTAEETISDLVSSEFRQGTAAAFVCTDCHPEYVPEITVHKGAGPGGKNIEETYEHEDPDVAPQQVHLLLTPMPKQLVVTVEYGITVDDNGKRTGVDRPIQDAYGQDINIETVRASDDDENQATIDTTRYRFVGGVFRNSDDGRDQGSHFRTLLKETPNTYRLYDGQAPDHKNRGMVIGGLEDEYTEDQTDVFHDNVFGRHPCILVYERMDEGDITALEKWEQQQQDGGEEEGNGEEKRVEKRNDKKPEKKEEKKPEEKKPYEKKPEEKPEVKKGKKGKATKAPKPADEGDESWNKSLSDGAESDNKDDSDYQDDKKKTTKGTKKGTKAKGKQKKSTKGAKGTTKK